MNSCAKLSVVKRLHGCPDGATHDALLQFHNHGEIAQALVDGSIRLEVRSYAKPRDLKVLWFHSKSKGNHNGK